MIRALLIYLIVFAVFFFGILGFRELTGKEKWELTKALTYSLMCATLAFVSLVFIVVLF